MAPIVGMRLRDAASALSISPSLLWRWCQDSALAVPHARIGGVIIFPERELRDWLARQAAATAAAEQAEVATPRVAASG